MTTLTTILVEGTEAMECPAKARLHGEPTFDVPSLLFDNRTPFSAVQFDIVDQHDQPFHVFVAKIGYRVGKCDNKGWATLTALNVPVELNTEDRHYRDDPSASVVEESDFAPYKPKCDVIVNACAHAPGTIATKRFPVRLKVTAPVSDLPKESPPLVDKELEVCGERWFVKKSLLRRILQLPEKVASLGMARTTSWRLTTPAPISHIPLRYEHAAGGECRIGSDDIAIKRLSEKRKLPIEHEACETNPVGIGFARSWYLKASKTKRVPAPQITSKSRPYDQKRFGHIVDGAPPGQPAGFGVIGRAWLPRREFVGTFTEKALGVEEIPRLPADFDFAYWNCAPLDQQCNYLNGGEQFELTNMVTPESLVASKDAKRGMILRFALPKQVMFVMAVDREAKVTVLPLSLDTVVINTESLRVDLVWRGCVEADGSHISSRLMHITQAEQIARLNLLIERQWPASSHIESVQT